MLDAPSHRPWWLSLLHAAARRQRTFAHGVRIAIFVIMAWIGALKFVPYEADGIVPFVANSPTMSFFYEFEPPEYASHMNSEGKLVEANRAWHEANHTYAFAKGLGLVIIGIGVVLLAGIVSPRLGLVGAVLTIGMSIVTLSFLITTPESWVPALGDAHHGFPYLSGRGRLVVKDLIMLAGALVCLSDSARMFLEQTLGPPERARQLVDARPGT